LSGGLGIGKIPQLGLSNGLPDFGPFFCQRAVRRKVGISDSSFLRAMLLLLYCNHPSTGWFISTANVQQAVGLFLCRLPQFQY
jgi:hypothetical protein